MGCDIHEHFEIRTEGGWKRIQVLPELGWNTSTPEQEEAYWRLPLFIGRDYDLFAVLAGVRNRLNLLPIASPRGLPDDVSDEVREDWNQAQRFPEVHSPSWLSLYELLTFDWDQSVIHLESIVEQDTRWVRPELVTYRDVISENRFVAEGLAQLQEFVADPSNLRMVFWFDS